METSTLHSAGYLLTKIGQVTTARFADLLAPLGIRPKHFGLLAAIATLPPSTQQELARALGLVASAIVEIIDDLEALAAVRRVPRPLDRRSYQIEITPAGSRLLEKALAAGDEVDRLLLDGLAPADADSFERSLVAIAARLGVPGAA